MKKKYLLLLFLFAFTKAFNAQVGLSVYSEVSIMTAGPGTELYEAFGHSAIRIKDPVLKLDLIYNYGMFDFNTPNFLLNFAKGNMVYSLARYDFKYFLASYKRDKRWLKQQVLNLTQEERQAFFTYLETNALPENKNYSYDPYFNNCATKLRDITKTILGDKLAFNDNYLKKGLTFRNLTNKEIHWNTWGSFGLNLIAGINLDKKTSSEGYMFLPDYVHSSFKNASVFIKNQPEKLVKKENILLNFTEKKQEVSIFNPISVLILITLFGIYITYKDFKNNTRSKYLDITLLIVTGLIGFALFFLWFFSTHSTAPNNFNVLWANPLNFVIVFLMFQKKQKKWLKHYFIFLLILLVIIPILWVLQIQLFPISVIPLLILLFLRFLFLSKKLN